VCENFNSFSVALSSVFSIGVPVILYSTMLGILLVYKVVILVLFIRDRNSNPVKSELAFGKEVRLVF
jgi:hypothetical protein